MITIKGKEYFYDEAQVVSFAEGLVGLPELRRAVVVPMDGCEPFCWLASIEDDRTRFIVVDPSEIYAGYNVVPSAAVAVSATKTLALVCVSSDWKKTTVNLRAPIVIDTAHRRGAQFILAESRYSLVEPIPQI